jgi:hypothetical protein
MESKNKIKPTEALTAVAFKMVGNWETQSKQLKRNYPQLTDADLKFVVGKENDLLARVESRLKKNRQEVIDIIKKGQLVKV